MVQASAESAFARIDADLDLSIARVRMIAYHSEEPVDVVGTPEGYRLELALLPRPKTGRVCFSDRWGPHRYEPLGELFMIPPGEMMRARGESSNQLSLVCEFDPAAVTTWFDEELDWSGSSLECNLNMASPSLKASLRRFHDEITNPGMASHTLCELIAAQAALDLARYCKTIDPMGASGGLAAWRLRRIDERLADHGSSPSLGELAKLCGLSVRQLTRSYRTSRGRSIGADIARSRIDHAKHLLARQVPAKEIAHTLGFRSPSNFSSAFLREANETPSQYRARIASSR